MFVWCVWNSFATNLNVNQDSSQVIVFKSLVLNDHKSSLQQKATNLISTKTNIFTVYFKTIIGNSRQFKYSNWIANNNKYNYNVISFYLQRSTETSHNSHFLLQLVNGQLFISQHLNGELLTEYLPLSPSNQIYSHNITVTITTNETTISLDGCVSHQCHVTLRPSVIGYSINLNSDVWIGGLGRMTPYIRSKVATTNGFQGCIGVGGLYILFLTVLSYSHFVHTCMFATFYFLLLFMLKALFTPTFINYFLHKHSVFFCIN